MRVRHTDEWIGLLVVAAIAILIVAIMQAGVLRAWFEPVSTLRIVLPATGVAGLETNADVEVLGTRAGIVRRIVIDPRQQMYAIVEIDQQAKAFIRRDSAAVIRRRFGLAGAAFIDISRGTGQEMDWSYAVIDATTERAPTDSISAIIDEMREKIFPILDNVGRATKGLAEVMDRINRGEGNVGRLLVDESMTKQIEATIASAHDSVTALNLIMADLGQSAKQVNGLTRDVSAPEGVPALLKRTDAVLDNLQIAMKNLTEASTRMPAISRNVESSTANLPALLTQTQLTAQQLAQLLTQIRSLWLLGGNNAPPAPASSERLPTTEVRP
jgi:phospholipid/cholesterol/gamma-HCH transport system substrate-binding protein